MRAVTLPARVGAASLAVLGAAFVAAGRTAAAAPAAPRLASGESASAASIAKAVNLVRSDLPSSVTWTSSRQAANNKVTAAAGKKAASCVQKNAGASTGDAFGASGATGGSVLADVKSQQFSDKAHSFTQLPAANSEVVVVSSSKDATGDLAAVGKKATLACFGAQYLVDAEQSGSGSVKVTESFFGVPHHGSGNGGVGIRLMASGGLLPEKLYNDEYFYADGRVEVVLSFLDIGSPFSTSWANAAAAKVMQRAAKAAG